MWARDGFREWLRPRPYQQSFGSLSDWRAIAGDATRHWGETSWQPGGFFFQAEDGIRDYKVTGVQTCALPICRAQNTVPQIVGGDHRQANGFAAFFRHRESLRKKMLLDAAEKLIGVEIRFAGSGEIGRASCRERV